MSLQYEKNYTEQGYLQNCQKAPNTSYYKSRLLQFKIELKGIQPFIW